MTPQFDWRLIRCFLAGLEHGSLLRAARALGSSQPTMGRYLSELESQLGVVLFERTGRGLKPTTAALALADSARAMETHALALSATLMQQQAQLGGTVRITASEAIATLALPLVLRDMRRALPSIQVEVVSSNTVSNLLRREADIAIRMVRPDQSTLVARKIGEIAMGVYASRHYLDRRGVPLKIDDLARHDLIGDDLSDNIIRHARKLGHAFVPQSFALRCDSAMVQWNAVRSGYGLGFMGSFQARQEPDLVQVLPALRIPALTVWLAVHREIRTSARIRAVFDFLAQQLPTHL
jgi:DNA-binding transcriptional LysR family regulator